MVKIKLLILLFLCSVSVACAIDQTTHETDLISKDKADFSILGNSISTYPNYIPDNHVTFYTQEHFNVEETWWMKLANLLGWELNSNVSWSGSRIAYDGIWGCESYFYSYDRINLLGGYKDPDYIFIEGGTNDWAWGSINGSLYGNIGDCDSTSFCGASNLMMQRIKQMYPNSTINCLGIFPRTPGMDIKCVQGWTLNDGNNALKEIAYLNDVIFISMDDCGIDGHFEEYTFDGLHPNSDGMTLVANHIFRQLQQETYATEVKYAHPSTYFHFNLAGRIIPFDKEGIHIISGKKFYRKNEF